MKANELMIGDWVCVTKDFTQKYHKIRALSNDKGAVLRGIYVNEYGVENYSIFSPNDTEPIPLTPEILEKNGFFTKDEQGNWKGYRIYSIFDANKNCTFMLKLYEKDSIYEISLDMAPYYITFKYVHQLQHALKLCGINKEIVL